ncbi:MAG: dihydrolipoamide acetyltransferase family protein, partial [Bacteroidota bacterium]
DVLGSYGGDGAAAPAEVTPASSTEAAPSPQESAPQGDGAVVENVQPVPVPAAEGERIKASPLARRMAQEGGIDLASLRGSGPDGRVVKRDVEAALEGTATPVAAQPVAVPAATPVAPAAPRQPVAAGGDEIRITQMRKTIARRLAQSKFTAPHFYLTAEVDMAEAVAFRTDINALTEKRGLAKVSFNDLVTKACAVALRKHPMVNASYLEDEGIIRQHDHASVAVAVAIDEGLVTPVVRNADQKGLAQIAAETRELAGKARDRTLDPSEWEGSTFTTSNLGMFGIHEFTAIINPPNACILAIGAIRDVPVVSDGEVVPGKRMTVTLSCDHRVVDGATGAQFLGDVKAMLEQPSLMLL